MKKIIFILAIIFHIPVSYSDTNIAYVDLNKLINESLVGISLNKQIDSFEKNNYEKFKLVEIDLKSQEELIVSKRNIISDDEFKKEVNILRKKFNEYNNERKLFENNFKKVKIKYTQEILNLLNPVLTSYIDENSISLLFDKNELVIGKKNLDITNQILILLNNKVKHIDFKYEKL